MDISKQKYFLADGDFYLHKILHTPDKDKKAPIKGQPKKIKLDTKLEVENFKVSVHNSIVNVFNNMMGCFDEFIIVFDNNSWRKGIEPHRPYFIDEMDATPLRYKANRDADKENADINYDNFYKAKKEIIEELLNEKVKVLCVEGCEGDDLLMYLANKNVLNLLLIHCSDGDLKYIVSDNVILHRSIKSKVSPDGEFVISEKLFNELFGKQDILTIFTQPNSTKADTLKRIFQLDFQNKGNYIRREPNISVVKTEKHIGLFVKCVCGDAKDNIFPIFRWLNGTGTMWNKVTELMIQKAFTKIFTEETYCDESIKRLFFETENRDNNLINLFATIIEQKKLNIGVTEHKILEHYKHNLKMNLLDVNNLPEHLSEKIKENLKLISTFPRFINLNKKLHSKENQFKSNLTKNII